MAKKKERVPQNFCQVVTLPNISTTLSMILEKKKERREDEMLNQKECGKKDQFFFSLPYWEVSTICKEANLNFYPYFVYFSFYFIMLIAKLFDL